LQPSRLLALPTHILGSKSKEWRKLEQGFHKGDEGARWPRRRRCLGSAPHQAALGSCNLQLLWRHHNFKVSHSPVSRLKDVFSAQTVLTWLQDGAIRLCMLLKSFKLLSDEAMYQLQG
jgi:hypothetical protein